MLLHLLEFGDGVEVDVAEALEPAADLLHLRIHRFEIDLLRIRRLGRDVDEVQPLVLLDLLHEGLDPHAQLRVPEAELLEPLAQILVQAVHLVPALLLAPGFGLEPSELRARLHEGGARLRALLLPLPDERLGLRDFHLGVGPTLGQRRGLGFEVGRARRKCPCLGDRTLGPAARRLPPGAGLREHEADLHAMLAGGSPRGLRREVAAGRFLGLGLQGRLLLLEAGHAAPRNRGRLVGVGQGLDGLRALRLEHGGGIHDLSELALRAGQGLAAPAPVLRVTGEVGAHRRRRGLGRLQRHLGLLPAPPTNARAPRRGASPRPGGRAARRGAPRAPDPARPRRRGAPRLPSPGPPTA